MFCENSYLFNSTLVTKALGTPALDSLESWKKICGHFYVTENIKKELC